MQHAAADIDEPEASEPDPHEDGDTGDAEHRLEQIRRDHEAEDDALGRQRRQNVRVDVQLPITLRIAGREAPGRSRDVSATGVGFSTRIPLEMDQRGEVTIDFGNWRFTKPFAVKFMKPILAGTQVGAQFEELSPEERESLVKQVFDVQRSQLRSEKKR